MDMFTAPWWIFVTAFIIGSVIGWNIVSWQRRQLKRKREAEERAHRAFMRSIHAGRRRPTAVADDRLAGRTDGSAWLTDSLDWAIERERHAPDNPNNGNGDKD